MKTPYQQHELDRMKDDPNNYKWYIFYYNPRDARVFIPKRNKMTGYTLNFGSPYSYLIILGIILFVYITNTFI